MMAKLKRHPAKLCRGIRFFFETQTLQLQRRYFRKNFFASGMFLACPPMPQPFIAFDSIYAHPLPEGHRFPMLKYKLIPAQLLHEGTSAQ